MKGEWAGPFNHTLSSCWLASSLRMDQNAEERQRNKAAMRRRASDYLVHSSECQDSMCRQAYCKKIKELILHTRDCEERQTGICMICKYFVVLCIIHARECKKIRCQFRVCASIKQKLVHKNQDLSH